MPFSPNQTYFTLQKRTLQTNSLPSLCLSATPITTSTKPLTTNTDMKLKIKLLFKVKSLSTPCRSMLSIFKFKTPIYIRSLRFWKHQSKPKKSPPKKLATKLKSLFNSLRESRKMDKFKMLKSLSDVGYQNAPLSSPITPAYVKMKAAYDHKEEEEVEEACRSFEKCLMEMIVEGGRMGDLVDVEELLCNWKILKSPIFVDLVCRFYRELCKDLFGNRGHLIQPN